MNTDIYQIVLNEHMLILWTACVKTLKKREQNEWESERKESERKVINKALTEYPITVQNPTSPDRSKRRKF